MITPILLGGAAVGALVYSMFTSHPAADSVSHSAPSHGGNANDGGLSPANVKEMQSELNSYLSSRGKVLLKEDGIMGPLTCGAARWAAEQGFTFSTEQLYQAATTCSGGTAPADAAGGSSPTSGSHAAKLYDSVVSWVSNVTGLDKQAVIDASTKYGVSLCDEIPALVNAGHSPPPDVYTYL